MEEQEGRAASVFIASRPETWAAAHLVRRDLEHHGFDVHLDGHLEPETLREVEDHTHVVVVLSPRSLDAIFDADDRLRAQIRHALFERKQIVPVGIDGFGFDRATLPADVDDLRRYQLLPLGREDVDGALERLRTRFLGGGTDPDGQPDAAGYYADLAHRSLAQERFSDALDHAMRGIRRDADNAECHLILGLVHIQERRYEDAGRELRRAAELSEADNPEIRRALARVALAGRPPDLAAAWRHWPESPDIRRMYLEQLKSALDPDWALAYEVDVDRTDAQVAGRYALSLISKYLGTTPVLEPAEVDDITRAFAVAPFAFGVSWPVAWTRAWRMADIRRTSVEATFVHVLRLRFNQLDPASNKEQLTVLAGRLLVERTLPGHIAGELRKMIRSARDGSGSFRRRASRRFGDDRDLP